MKKTVIYNEDHEAYFVNGKFSAMLVQDMCNSDPDPETGSTYIMYKHDVYFMLNGLLHKAIGVPDFDSASFDDDKYLQYLMKRIRRGKIPFERCHSIREALEKVKGRDDWIERTTVMIETNKVFLVHDPSRGFIEAVYIKGDDHRRAAVLTYDNFNTSGKFRYGLRAHEENMVYEFPDLDDSSVQMNFMLSGGNVKHLRAVVTFFREYTKRMDIKY